MTEQVEIAVVGAGPGGLSAALAAAQAGAQVALIDNNRHPGGQYYRQTARAFRGEPSSHQREGAALLQQVVAAGARIIAETNVWGAFDDKTLALNDGASTTYLQARAIILATGAYDRPVAFPGWTLPGVMTAGAVQTLLKEQRILPGKRFLLAGTGPLQLVLAAELARAGAQVVAVLEGRGGVTPPLLPHAGALWGQWARLSEGMSSWLTLARHRIPYRVGWGIVAAEGAAQVEQATIARLDENWRPIRGSEEKIACDTIGLGYGFIPFNALSRLLGAKKEWRPELGGQVPVRDAQMQTSAPGVYAVGDCAGIGGAMLARVEGQVAGIAAAAQLGHRSENLAKVSFDSAQDEPSPGFRALARERRFQQMYAALFTPGAGLYELSRDDTILCRCEEITQAEVRRAIALGADTTNEIKLITRGGMGDCQGRMCAHLIAHFIARETGRSVAQVGMLPPRPPIFPIPITALGVTR